VVQIVVVTNPTYGQREGRFLNCSSVSIDLINRIQDGDSEGFASLCK